MKANLSNKKRNTPHLYLAPHAVRVSHSDFHYVAEWKGYKAFGRTPLIAQGRVIIQAQARQVIHE